MQIEREAQSGACRGALEADMEDARACQLGGGRLTDASNPREATRRTMEWLLVGQPAKPRSNFDWIRQIQVSRERGCHLCSQEGEWTPRTACGRQPCCQQPVSSAALPLLVYVYCFDLSHLNGGPSIHACTRLSNFVCAAVFCHSTYPLHLGCYTTGHRGRQGGGLAC